MSDLIPGMSGKDLAKLCGTLEATGFVTYVGEVWLATWSKSTAKKSPEITLTMDEDDALNNFEGATIRKGKQAGQRYKVIFIEIGDDEEPIPPRAYHKKTKKAAAVATPYGDQAKALKLSSFFRNPKVWAKVGTDEEYRAWLRGKTCSVPSCGSTQTEAAHVGAVKDGSGTAIKPEYSAHPLCIPHHRGTEHHEGICKLTGVEDKYKARDILDQWKIKWVSGWAWSALKEQLGYESWSEVPPEMLIAWAQSYELDGFLPIDYKE